MRKKINRFVAIASGNDEKTGKENNAKNNLGVVTLPRRHSTFRGLLRGKISFFTDLSRGNERQCYSY